MSPAWTFGLLALALYAAAWGSRKLGISSVAGFLVLGMLVGPGGPLADGPLAGGPLAPFEAGPVTDLLAELGLLLLLFAMGLEFTLQRFAEGGRATLVAGSIDLVNLLVGVLAGLAFGFGAWGAVFLGAAVYISSSGVIAKLLSERALIAYPEAERTLGVLVFEDLAMVVVLGGLGLATAGGDAWRFAGVAAVLVGYVVLLRVGRGALERLLDREGEALALLLLGALLVASLAAKELGFPEAVAAFLLGMVVADSRHRDRVESTLASWLHVAAAVFFFDVGLHVDLAAAWAYLPQAAALLVLMMGTQLATGTLAGRATGLSRRGAVGHGLMLLPRGEFSLVILGLAAAAPQIPADVRMALYATVSAYVVASILVGSVVFARYDAINDRLARALRGPAARRRDAARHADLEAMRGGARRDGAAAGGGDRSVSRGRR